MTDIATTEPAAITAGSTIKWTKNLSDYKPEDSWVLSYSLFNSSNQYTVAATDNGDSTHLADIAAAISADYAVGDYQWQAYVTKTTERYDVGCGEIRINANAATGAVDGRSHVKKTLDAIEATIEIRSTQGNESYSVDGVSVTKRSTEDLLALRTKYQAEYASEQKAASLANGLGHSSRVRVRI